MASIIMPGTQLTENQVLLKKKILGFQM